MGVDFDSARFRRTDTEACPISSPSRGILRLRFGIHPFYLFQVLPFITNDGIRWKSRSQRQTEPGVCILKSRPGAHLACGAFADWLPTAIDNDHHGLKSGHALLSFHARTHAFRV